MLIVDKLKGNLYTRIKKHMTKKCITFIIVKTGKFHSIKKNMKQTY